MSEFFQPDESSDPFPPPAHTPPDFATADELPKQREPIDIAEEEIDIESPGASTMRYQGTASDPAFGYLLAIALSIGLIPLLPESSDLRYTILWSVMAGFGVLAWLLGNSARIGEETLDNLSWGVVFGLIVGAPLLIVGSSQLGTTVERLFPGMSAGALLAYLIFVMPTAETLFFRAVLQETLTFWLVGVLGSVWSILVFFPLVDVGEFPAVAVVIGTALVMMNLIYSYVRQRNGLAAAWLCQIVVNLILLFLPTL